MATSSTSFERLAGSVLLFAVALATCARCQTPADTFSRDFMGHRVTAPGSGVTLSPSVTAQLATLLGTKRPSPLFFCVHGHPDSLGVFVSSLTPTSLTTPRPRCNDRLFIGGLTVLPHLDSEPLDEWLRVARVLASRSDFVLLVVVDTLLEDGPRLRWLTATTIPVDTTDTIPPTWMRRT